MDYNIEYLEKFNKYKAKPYKRMKSALDSIENAYTNYYMEGCSDYEGFTREDYESMRSLFRKIRPLFENVGINLKELDDHDLLDIEIYDSIENGNLIGTFNVIEKKDLINLIGDGCSNTIAHNIMDNIEHLWKYHKKLRNIDNIKLIKLTIDIDDVVRITY